MMMTDRIRHTTGYCPVAPSIQVRVWHSDPFLPTPEYAEGIAGSFDWRILGDGEDIAYYQVVFTEKDEAHKDTDPLGRGRVKVPFAYCCSSDPATCDCVNPDHGHAWRLLDVPRKSAV